MGGSEEGRAFFEEGAAAITGVGGGEGVRGVRFGTSYRSCQRGVNRTRHLSDRVRASIGERGGGRVADSSTLSAPGRGLPLPSTLFGRSVFYGWYIVAVAWLVSMMSMGISAYGRGVFITPMTGELGWSRTDISLG